MRVVVFAPSASELDTGLADLGSVADVLVITTAPTVLRGVEVLAVGVPRARARLSNRFRRTMVGRVLRRVTPLDPGAMFAGRVRRSSAARSAIAEADLLVSAERDASFAVWREARRRARQGRAVAAVAGFPAARVLAE